MVFQPESLSTLDLLQAYAQILDELRVRKIVRTSNNPIGDYAEWLVANKLGLTLTENSTAGFDAFSDNVKFQIKSRRITQRNRSRQLGAIRNLANHDFNYLIADLFNENVEVMQVVKMHHDIIGKYARYSEHVHAHILVLRGAILSDPMLEDITSLFQK